MMSARLQRKGNNMSRLIGPDFVALQVRDLDAAKEFYVDTLGLVAQPQSPPGAVVFDTAPIPFAIREPLVDLDEGSKLGWGMSLWMSCDDTEGLHQRLVDAGVTITSDPSDGPFGRQFAFQDLDGYPITVHQTS
jgi:catechol 2,3-dioxygenase-like lactoylglutathione lyase family enzyme